MIVAVPYMPSRSSPLGLGRSISTRIVRVVGSSDSAIRATVPEKVWLPRASTAKTAGSPTFVMTTSRSGTCTMTRIRSVRLTVRSDDLAPLGRRADEGPRVKGPVGHDAVERGDDPGVVDVDAGRGQPGFGHLDGRLGLGDVGACLLDLGGGGRELGFRGQDREPGGPFGGDGGVELALVLVDQPRRRPRDPRPVP